MMETSRELPGLKGVLALGGAVSGTIVGSGGGSVEASQQGSDPPHQHWRNKQC